MSEVFDPYGLEKSNFHIHLTGALSPDQIRQIGTIVNPGGTTYEHLVKPPDFEQPELWIAAKLLTCSEQGLVAAIDRVVRNERAANVQYLELTLNSLGMVQRGMEPLQLAQVLVVAAERAAQSDVTLRIKFGVNRKDGPDSVGAVLDSYRVCPDPIRVGIDLNGDERLYPTADFVDSFRKLSQAGIRTTIHAGEFPGMTASLSDALDAEPARIAHAVAAVESDSLMRRILSQEVVVETALTSNLHRGIVAAIGTHPVRQMLECQMPIVMGTDDPGFFGNSMNKELELLSSLPMSEPEVVALNALMNSRRLN